MSEDQYDINDIPRGDGTEPEPALEPEAPALEPEQPALEPDEPELTPPTPPDGPTPEGA